MRVMTSATMAARSASSQLGRQVDGEDLALGPLPLGLLGAAGTGEGLGGLPALLRLAAQHRLHLVVGELTGLLAGDLLGADRGEHHAQRRRAQLVTGLHGGGQVVAQLLLQIGHGHQPGTAPSRPAPVGSRCALVHRPRRRLRHGRRHARLREPLRAHPLDAAPVRRPGAGPRLRAAEGAAPLRPAHDRRAAVEAGVGRVARRAGAGPGRQHRRQPGRLRRGPADAGGAGAADGAAGRVRARPATTTTRPGRRTRSSTSSPATSGVHGAELPWRDLRDGMLDRGWLDLTNAAGELVVDGRRIVFAGVDDSHLSGTGYDVVAGRADRAADLRLGTGPLPRAAGAGPVRRRRPRPAAVPATPTAASCGCRSTARW